MSKVLLDFLIELSKSKTKSDAFKANPELLMPSGLTQQEKETLMAMLSTRITQLEGAPLPDGIIDQSMPEPPPIEEPAPKPPKKRRKPRKPAKKPKKPAKKKKTSKKKTSKKKK